MISLQSTKKNSSSFPFKFFNDILEWQTYTSEYPELLTQIAPSPDSRFTGDKAIDVFMKAVEYIPRSLIPRPYQYWLGQRMIGFLNDEKKGRVLDYGGGAGNMGMMFAHAGFTVDFLEVEGVITDFLRWRVKRHFLTSRVFGHDKELGINQYDFVSLLNVVEHLDNPMETVQRITKALAPGGYLLMICNTSGKGLDVVSVDTLENVIKPYLLTEYTLVENTDSMLYRKKDENINPNNNN